MDIESYYDKIYKYIYFKVNNKTQAEDLTQETFLRFMKSECNEPERYLYTIAGNLCIDEYRRIKPVFTEDEDITQVEEGFEDKILEKQVLANALKVLSDEDREMIVLRFVNEEPIGEIAKLYGISRFALTRKLNKAKNRLKEELERGTYER
ncbi:MAG: sigma-70 family RNA polymerase sigma factor [Lachnospiraceae bacterium]|nr:sigma-70 family RNA polymerase sigma factor [Lachnospiraceae bacterium]